MSERSGRTNRAPLIVSAPDILIGARLRAARQARAMTIDHVAKATGLSKGFVSRVERDETSPSVATLTRLCAALDLNVGTLFETPELDRVVYGDQPMVPLVGESVTEYLMTPRRQPRLQLTHALINPGGSSGDELITMNCRVEVAYVLRGTLELIFATESTMLAAGETLTFSGYEPHRWRNPQDNDDSEVLWIMLPAPWSTSEG